jgi:hypothetical protein
MLNTMFNIRAKTGANKGKQDIAVLSMFIEILRTAANSKKTGLRFSHGENRGSSPLGSARASE